MNYLDFVLAAQKFGEPRGIFSICSAHPFVLKAAFRHARLRQSPVLVEATCNQVNQFGGYTGLTPDDFVSFLHCAALENNYSPERLILGGDHLGPNVWQAEPSESAMRKALDMVEAYARAGFTKLHLDASMRLADDPFAPLPPELVAARTAQLAQVAEQAAPDPSTLRYVIGTEVPTPGGATARHDLDGLHITQPADVHQTISLTQGAFHQLGLDAAWERVIAVVVQPGVEFGDDEVVEYRPQAANALSAFIETQPRLVYEAHSTDYQTREALRGLVRDHFAILKVGPGLTFAFREAVFALTSIQQELLPGEAWSNVPDALNAAALRRPEYWQKYYQGNSREQALKRKYSLSDRIRYYWADPAVQAALSHLLHSFDDRPLPFSLISQYLPNQYAHIRGGSLANHALDILLDRITDVLDDYASACALSANGQPQTQPRLAGFGHA